MDPLEEFLSPEALRLLLDSDDFATTVHKPSVTTSDQSLSVVSPLAAAVNIPLSNESKPTRKRLASDPNITGCSTLVLDKAGSAKPKRAKFNAEGRAKVASIRKKGACMKCHRNKIPCSGEWPCESCCRSRAVIAGRASRHRWMDCVPFSMKDLDIFANEIVQEDHLIEESLQKIHGCFNDDFWNVWQDEVKFTMKTKSDANACYWKHDCLQLLAGFPTRHWWISMSKDSIANRLDRRLDKTFHLLTATYLMGYIGTKRLIQGCDVEDIRDARSVAGSKLLQCLEKVLSNTSLSDFGADTLRALVIIICFTILVVNGPAPRAQSFPGFYDRQRQLICVLAHHAVYIGERVIVWEGVDKETFIRAFSSIAWIEKPLHPESESKPHASNNSSHTLNIPFSVHNGHGKADNLFNGGSMVANTSLCPIKHCNQPLEETSAAIPPALDERKRTFSQTMLYTEADTVSEQEVERGIVQRRTTARSPYLPGIQPEDRDWPFTDHNQIGRTISTTTANPLPELQPTTFCAWCDSFQTSYKPSQGVVSCDVCFTPYQQNSSTLPGGDLGQPRSTDQSFRPAGELDALQDDSTNHASWPDLTASSSSGNDIDDFSWLMA